MQKERISAVVYTEAPFRAWGSTLIRISGSIFSVYCILIGFGVAAPMWIIWTGFSVVVFACILTAIGKARGEREVAVRSVFLDPAPAGPQAKPEPSVDYELITLIKGPKNGDVVPWTGGNFVHFHELPPSTFIDHSRRPMVDFTAIVYQRIPGTSVFEFQP